jgi:Spy/CpxP family protein refolding chaperone
VTRRQLAGLAGYLGVFLLGAVTGGFAMHAKDARSDATVFDDRGGSRHRMYVWSLDKKLGLSAAQRQRIEAILAMHDAERDAILAPVEPRMKALRALIRGEIREALTPEQGREFDELMRRYDEGRAQRRGQSPSL